MSLNRHSRAAVQEVSASASVSTASSGDPSRFLNGVCVCVRAGCMCVCVRFVCIFVWNDAMRWAMSWAECLTMSRG